MTTYRFSLLAIMFSCAWEKVSNLIHGPQIWKVLFLKSLAFGRNVAAVTEVSLPLSAESLKLNAVYFPFQKEGAVLHDSLH